MKKAMKQTAAFLLALFMMVQLAPIAVMAAGTEATVALVGSTAEAGDTVTVDVVLSNNPGIVAMQLLVEYDESVLTLEQVQDKGLLGANTHKNELVSPYTLRWVDGTAEQNYTVNGSVVTLVFRIAEGTPEGQYPVTVSYNSEDGIMDKDMQKVPFAVENGVVTVGKPAATALDDFEYERNGNELTIVEYVGTAARVIIGETYEIGGVACTVTAIEAEAFLGNEDITSITMNSGLKEIGEAAFYECVNLETVKLNAGLEFVGAEAFYGCESLLSVAVPGKATELDEVSFGYMKSGRKDALIEGFQMIGFAGSTAEAYAAENEIPFQAIVFDFAGASITLTHNLAVNFKADKALFEAYGYTNPYVVFVRDGEETTVTDYTVKDGKYVFTYRNIAPNQMTDTITATLYATQAGQLCNSAAKEYSVAEYCYSMLSEENAKLRTLLVDLLHYGAASQTFTGYKTNDLADAALTAAQLAWGTSAAPTLESILNTAYQTVSNPKATWKGAGLYLEDSVTLRLKLAAENITGLSVKIVSGGNTWTIPASEFVSTGGNQYYVYFNGLHAGQMRQSVQMTVCQGDTAVSNTALYSIESYAFEQQNSTVAGLADLVQAMMKYGDSAYAYAN